MLPYLQPGTRGELSNMFGMDRTLSPAFATVFLGSGPSSPTPGAPYTYVTTKHFLSAFALETLRDLPDLERLEDAGLLSRQAPGRDAFAEEGSDSDEPDDG